jgi:hypothetical protein
MSTESLQIKAIHSIFLGMLGNFNVSSVVYRERVSG